MCGGVRLFVRGGRWLASALTLAVPVLVYSGLVMTEVLFYPVLVVAAWAMASALERPSWQRQALLVVAVLAAVATRLQAVVLLPAFATALGLDAVLRRSTRGLRRLMPAMAAMALLAACWLVWRLVGGEAVLGGYGVVTRISYGVGRASRFRSLPRRRPCAADGSVSAGLRGVAACSIVAVRHGEADRRAAAYLAVTVSLSVWLVLEVGVFASRYVGQLAERGPDWVGAAVLPRLCALAPTWWAARLLGDVGRGRRDRRPRRGATAETACYVLCTAGCAPALSRSTTCLPQRRRQRSRLCSSRQRAVAITVFGLMPRPALIALPIILLAALTASSIAASRYVADQSRQRQQTFLGPDARWIDHAGANNVAYLFQPGDDWVGVWETAFWNRSVTRVYDLGATNVFGPMPQQQIVLRPDGRLTRPDGKAISAPYIVSSTGVVASEPVLAYVGQPVAETDPAGKPTHRLRALARRPALQARVPDHRPQTQRRHLPRRRRPHHRLHLPPRRVPHHPPDQATPNNHHPPKRPHLPPTPLPIPPAKPALASNHPHPTPTRQPHVHPRHPPKRTHRNNRLPSRIDRPAKHPQGPRRATALAGRRNHEGSTEPVTRHASLECQHTTHGCEQ